MPAADSLAGMNPLLRRALRLARAVAGNAVRDRARRRPVGTPERRRPEAGPRGATFPGDSRGEQHREAGSRSTTRYDVARLGLPEMTYTPRGDDQPDPGEVVWTWVPYDDDPGQGKDRPVLVLAREGAGLVATQMTSQDHDQDAADEARWGRYWHDIGSGDWDAQGRPSEVRLDTLLWVDPLAVRREGGALDAHRFQNVVRALREHHG